MNERISRLLELTLDGKMYVKPVSTAFDENDAILSKIQRESKRLCEYILNQEPMITEYSLFTGMFNFDGSVVGDAFQRSGHIENQMALDKYYLKKIDNLSTMEWQHATGDYSRVLSCGLFGMCTDIMNSYKNHNGKEEKEFLIALRSVCEAMIYWAYKCSTRARELAEKVENPTYKANLLKLSSTLQHIPKNPPQTFYDAILTIYFCFGANPDSVGTLDRYLTPFYERDLKNGNITPELAKEYLQELFLMLQATTHRNSPHFGRGGQSHFCIGGYLPNGEDGFNELSRLIVEALMELPTYIPQITLRWTKKTPKEVLRFMMDMERKDPHKRIAFTNDEKRIKAYTEICKIPYEKAVNYTTVGCNEPAFQGSIAGSTSKGNLLHSIETLFHKKHEKIANCKDFEEFYSEYLTILFEELDKVFEYDDMYNSLRAKDTNYISSLFASDCIENAKSVTAGGSSVGIASPMLMGTVNVIDSLIAVKQFVFDEKIITMTSLIDALHKNWQGYEDMRVLILKKCEFFGNDTDLSSSLAKRFFDDIYEHIRNRKNIFGYQWLLGDLAGYNQHYKWYGDDTLATPDGRFSGELMKFGLGQNEGKDRNGLTSLLNSIASCDENGIICGSTVTNISLDKKIFEDDEQFEKLVDIFEAYFKKGGVHFQLTYVSRDELLKARENPQNYGNLRVRVSGFSDYFVRLNNDIQDDIIKRTNS
ncbi:MAG: hypothetical protein E7622_01130 [Ruminococcaceae bacterium]|nr:hypothetical protein [Oscillospiraceae bacterium]